MTIASWRGTVPAFLVGLALALGTQVATGLLLYGGPGFISALAVVLAVAAVALAVGIISGSSGTAASRGPGDLEMIRRRWTLLLLALTLAALFSAGWEIFRGYGARGITQGLGLALMTALPLYAGGRLLAGLADTTLGRVPEDGAGEIGNAVAGRTRAQPSQAPAALVGAAAGFVLIGFVLFPTLSPTAVFLLAVVSTSGGALAHGWLLDEVIREVPLGSIGSGRHRLELRRHLRSRPPLDRILIVERGKVRLVRNGDGSPIDAEDHALEGGLFPRLPPPERVLAVGWRGLPVLARSVEEGTVIRVLDPDPGRARALLASVEIVPDGVDEAFYAVEVERGGWWSLLDGGHLPSEWGDSDWILLDARIGPAGFDAILQSGEVWATLERALAPAGTVVLTAMKEPDGPGSLLPVLQSARASFPSGAIYIGPDRSCFIALSNDPDRRWAREVGAYGLAVSPPEIEGGTDAEEGEDAGGTTTGAGA